MNKHVLKFLVVLIAISLAGCAAFFSIVGLSKLFAGAAIAVMVMASTLEASKLVITSFLYQAWSTINKTLRLYLLIAISIIAIITSIGIYGFLSSAYSETKSKYDLTQTQTDSLSTQKSYYESSVDNYKLQLTTKTSQLTNLSNIRNSQEARASQLVTNKRSSKSADKSAKETDAAIKLINLDIDNLNKNIITYSDSAKKIQVKITQLGLKNNISSELGSLSYVARLLNVSMDSVVNVLIILFIIVFDPLAICMVLVFNSMSNSKEEIQKKIYPQDNYLPKEEYIPYEPDFFVNPNAIIEDIIPEQPSEQPLEQSEPSTIISKPTQKTKEELKESIRQLAERKRNEKLDDLYNESNSKTY
jgi:hypothetical protein